MKNILFLVPDSTGIRNYLYSDILSNLKNKLNIHIWSPLPQHIFEDVIKLHGMPLHYQQFPFPKEPVLSRWLRESATFARLHWNARKVKNETILSNWHYQPEGSIGKKLFHKSCMVAGKMIENNYDSILKFEEKARESWSEDLIKKYENQLLDADIEKVFITHQRVAHLMPLCLAARNLGIEVVTVIYSWDNLPKARLNVLADKYLVWSDYMKDEMATYYSEIPQQKIIVTGTPQFEFYNKREFIVERETFAKQYQLEPNKKWLLYSGGDTN